VPGIVSRDPGLWYPCLLNLVVFPRLKGNRGRCNPVQSRVPVYAGLAGASPGAYSRWWWRWGGWVYGG